MFRIPIEHDINILTSDEKSELEDALNSFEDQYISNNRLSPNFKLKISLEKYLNIKYNLINSSQLLDKIRTNQINIKELPWLDPAQLDETHWKVYIDKRIKKRETIENMATTNIFKCFKCGGKKCTTYQLQIASIDEPMTTFIQCTECGNRWKI